MSKTISLTQGYVTVVDESDYEWLIQWEWCASVTHHRYVVAVRGEGGRKSRQTVLMHREILGLEPGDGVLVDHVSGDMLDNRRVNLRTATKAQNSMNRPAPVNSTTGVRGVFWNKQVGKYQAQIKFKGKQQYLGLFESLREAAEARWKAEQELFGEYGYFASQNRGDVA